MLNEFTVFLSCQKELIIVIFGDISMCPCVYHARVLTWLSLSHTHTHTHTHTQDCGTYLAKHTHSDILKDCGLMHTHIPTHIHKFALSHTHTHTHTHKHYYHGTYLAKHAHSNILKSHALHRPLFQAHSCHPKQIKSKYTLCVREWRIYMHINMRPAEFKLVGPLDYSLEIVCFRLPHKCTHITPTDELFTAHRRALMTPFSSA
jgi:hypothetical protein